MITTNGKSSHPPVVKSSRPPVVKSSRPPHVKSSAPPERLRATIPLPRKRKRLRKDEIVLEATRLFAERGYEGASMGDLAERVGLRKASLFHHFPSKDVLYATVLLQLIEGVRAAIVTAARTDGTFEARLDALTDALTAALAAQPHAARLLVREAMDWGPVMKERLGRTIQELLVASVDFVEAGQKEGVVERDVDAMQVVVSLVGVHFMPFAIGEIVERFTGTSPFHAAFVEQRKAAVRAQVRAVVLSKKRK